MFLITVGWEWLLQLPTRPPVIFPYTGWGGEPYYSTSTTGVGALYCGRLKILAPYLALSDITQLLFVVFALIEWLLSKCFMSC